ncbi:GNAT family N-acetyltransferase [Ammoniphilus sp. CFH 90114]|uniref:GNAT family N-acetyltransferase n=1 Tax=Ammoniphilus sp. CFH 90114 TaxID=2493665 RepID=UPI00100ED67D|nr:GNAT family N-acetyltransferase [Ammoniphilus sp. CFH 90114]RXT15477.1 GNAT family N-acetyltransferase [Ammoniphilus sp. CFH 90114]
MEELLFVKGYQQERRYRESFDQMAKQIFGISFETWFSHGYWDDRYVPYSYWDGEQMVANVSVNKISLMIEGQQRKAIQLGTVMTKPEYRNQGLSASLMKKVLEDDENQVDLIYLFANHSVLDYYPKFGFKPVDEFQFSLSYTNSSSPVLNGLVKLDGSNKRDLSFIFNFASRRWPVSPLFGSKQAEGILLFYCINVFSNDIYFIEEEEVIIIYKLDGNTLHLFDLIAQREVNLERVLQRICPHETTEVIFYFTPADPSLDKALFIGGEKLFMRAKEGLELPKYFKHPITSQA